MGLFALSALRNGLGVLALERRSLTTVLFPAAVGVACVLLMVMLLWRRVVLGAALQVERGVRSLQGSIPAACLYPDVFRDN